MGCSKGGMEPSADRDLSAGGWPDFSIAAHDLGGLGGPDLRVSADLLPPAPPTGDALWQKGAGGSGDDHATGIASDRSGNVYVTGLFYGSVDFGGGALVSAGQSDIFLLKYDPTGHLVYAKRFGNNQQDAGVAVAVDSMDNVVLLGTFGGAVDFGGGPLNSSASSNVVVAKYSPAGAHLWSRRFGGVSSDEATGVALDRHDNVLVTGIFSGQVDFGTGILEAQNGSDCFLLKLAADGKTTTWARRIGGDGYEWTGGVVADATDNVVVAGAFSDTVDFGGGGVSATNRHTDGFLAKYGPDNTLAWVQRMSGYSSDSAMVTGVASDGAGNLVVGGWFTGGVDLGSGPLTSSGDYDVFLGKYAPDGHPLWSIRGGGSSADQIAGVAVDATGSIVVTGNFQGSADFGGGKRTAAGLQDVLLAKYAPSGSHLWSRALGGAGTEEGLAVATDPLGNILLAGYYTQSPDFGGGPLPTATGEDLFILKRAP
jgi:hypothetical protein